MTSWDWWRSPCISWALGWRLMAETFPAKTGCCGLARESLPIYSKVFVIVGHCETSEKLINSLILNILRKILFCCGVTFLMQCAFCGCWTKHKIHNKVTKRLVHFTFWLPGPSLAYGVTWLSTWATWHQKATLRLLKTQRQDRQPTRWANTVTSAAWHNNNLFHISYRTS